jgi:hypothetical protein
MWINTETNAYPLHENDIRALMPSTSFAQPFNPPEPYAWVAPTPRPAHDSISEAVREIAPELVEGVYEQRWEVYALSEEQSAANLAAANLARFNQIVAEAQARLDAFARTRNYDDIKSACGYAGCSVQRFDTEGTYCRDARAETWAALYAMLEEVNAGTRPIPASLADLKAELPELAWPST